MSLAFFNIMLQSASQEEKIWRDVTSGMAPVSENVSCAALMNEGQTLLRVRVETICSPQLKLVFVSVDRCQSRATVC